MHIVELKDFTQLIAALQGAGYAVMGPRVRDGAIVIDPIERAEDLPRGWTDNHAPGSYSIEQSGSDEYFGYVVGPVSWKKFLFPPRLTLFNAQKTNKGFQTTAGSTDPPPMYAFLGVRPCELHALTIHDRIFSGGRYSDSHYAKTRERVFTVAVNCTKPGDTCFCSSMGTGPAAEDGYDLVLTEVVGSGVHHFVVRSGSPRGAALLEAVPHRDATDQEEQAAHARTTRTAGMMQKKLDVTNIKQLLYANFEHPEWEDVSKRCLACTNCTLVCPTCFCSTVEDTTDLAGTKAQRSRRWDSCFTIDYTKVAGGNVRPSRRARYRQWLTHKLAYWIDQFGTSGCVGCGRCITWCPAGIDITAEVDKIQRTTIMTGAR